MTNFIFASLMFVLTAVLIFVYVDTYGATFPPWSRPTQPHRAFSPSSQPQMPPRGAAATGSQRAHAALPPPPRTVLSPIPSAIAPQPHAQHIPEIAHTSRASGAVSSPGVLPALLHTLFAAPESALARVVREDYELQTWQRTIRLAEEAQRVRHRMEVAEIAHWGVLAAARAQIMDAERRRQEDAADQAQQRAEMLEDHARRRPQHLDDEARMRAESLADQARTRAQMLEDDQLARPWSVAEKRFRLEVQAHEQTATRASWSIAAARRAQATIDRARTRADAVEDARRARRQAIAAQDFAAEQTARSRLEARRVWADADEDRPHVRELAKRQQRYALEDASRARRQTQAEAAARRIDAARTRRLVRAQDARDEKRAQREEQLAIADADIALEERRAAQERRRPPVRDLAHEALTRDCELIALDVSTGTVLFDATNLYHGFAALKYHEARKTSGPDAALASTIAALVRRRAGQREITEAEARAFLAQYERVCDADATSEGFQNAKTILEQFGVGTEDAYASE